MFHLSSFTMSQIYIVFVIYVVVVVIVIVIVFCCNILCFVYFIYLNICHYIITQFVYCMFVKIILRMFSKLFFLFVQILGYILLHFSRWFIWKITVLQYKLIIYVTTTNHVSSKYTSEYISGHEEHI